MKKRNYEYPAETEGSKDARELRKRANQLSKQERADYLAKAMKRIYGAAVKTADSAGH